MNKLSPFWRGYFYFCILKNWIELGGLVKRILLPIGAFLITAFLGACSLNIEVEDPNPHGSTENPLPNTPAILPQDTAKAPVDNPVDNPVDDSLVVDGPENPEIAKDTIYLHDTLVVYKDTIYDTLYDTTSYTSFVYRKDSGMVDTVTMNSKALTCDVNDSSVSCQAERYIVWTDKCCITRIEPLDEVFFEPDENTIFVHVLDTIYIDAWHEEEYVSINDTTFVNYGDNRQTDFIPPEFVYKATKSPFDSTAVRALLDTLDFSRSDSTRVSFKVQSKLNFWGLPVTVKIATPTYDVITTKDGAIITYWPSEEEIRERSYYFAADELPSSDTTVTWTLGYTHYEKGIVETDSLQVTTFIKVK
jgi:hypothetical protein